MKILQRMSKKWVFDNPFKTEAGKQLIQVAAERGAIEHVLSDAEELLTQLRNESFLPPTALT